MQDAQVTKSLPLLDVDGKPVFENKEKCELLEQVFFEGTHLKQNNFDENFFKEINSECQTIKDNLNAFDGRESFNADIMFQEVEAAIQKIKAGKSPGPDSFYSELFQNAGENLKKAVLYIFNISWLEGQLPSTWKSANVKFLCKQGKSDYYSPSSYRPISLTSVLGKLMERIILARLEAYIEGNRLLDEEQQGFRRFRCTTYAVLKLVQAVREGFNKKESTLACFIDLEKAYDSVWREGLMVKLSRLGVKGRMWSWIFSFLSNRSVICKIGDFSGTEFVSHTGLPQGSVLSPILFNIFIMDMFEEVEGDFTKFADDGTVWHTGKNIPELAEKVAADVKKIQYHCNTWRMKISLCKTEVTLFQAEETCDNSSKNNLCKIDGSKLKYNSNLKLLGITLDEKLNFQEHVNRTEKKASRALQIIREVKGISKISTKKLINLYVTLVRSVMEYGCSVWQTVARPDLKKT